MNNILDIIFRFPKTLLSRDSIIDFFVESDLQTKEEAISSKTVRPGKLFTDHGSTFLVIEREGTKITKVEPIALSKNFKLSFNTKFILKPGIIANHKQGGIETTIGRFLLNYVILVEPFDGVLPYMNDSPLSLSKVEKLIATSLIEGSIKPKQVYQFIDNTYFLSSLNDFLVPSITAKSITSRPEVNKLRKELLSEYKDQLDNPNVMIKIEEELIKLDKELLQGDPSNGFMISGKNYDNHRKRMFIMIGAIPAFGDDQKSLSFATTNLNDGWKLDELDLLANDTRSGSYNRAKNTQKGGVIAKTAGRRFQESRISEDDCKTNKGIQIKITKFNKEHYLYKNMISNGKLVELNPSNIDSYIGQTIEIRSPMFCHTENGYCYTCQDTRYKKIGLTLLNLAPTNIGSALLNHTMKAMHHSKVSVFELADLNQFVV